MTISSETLFKLTEAVEKLATGGGSAIQRAQAACVALAGIKKEEFADNVAGVIWSYISGTSKTIREGAADASAVDKFNAAIWQLFNTYRPK